MLPDTYYKVTLFLNLFKGFFFQISKNFKVAPMLTYNGAIKTFKFRFIYLFILAYGWVVMNEVDQKSTSIPCHVVVL